MLHQLIAHATIDDEKRRERARRARRQETLSNDGGGPRPATAKGRWRRADEIDDDLVLDRDVDLDDGLPAWS